MGKTKTKVRGETLNWTAKKKANFYVIRALVYLGGRVTLDIPFKITRKKHSKAIVLPLFLLSLRSSRRTTPRNPLLCRNFVDTNMNIVRRVFLASFRLSSCILLPSALSILFDFPSWNLLIRVKSPIFKVKHVSLTTNFCNLTRCRINSKGFFLNGLSFEWNYTQLEFKPGTFEKNESAIGPPAGIEPTLLRCRCNALATELQR